MIDITQAFRQHYARKIKEHGPTPRGLDWGAEKDVLLRYDKMLGVIRPEEGATRPSLLDVGCGYGGLLRHAGRRQIALDYTGIDLVDQSVGIARAEHPEAAFIVDDVLTHDFTRRYDYVVCSGILTLKLTASIQDMNAYFQSVVRRMFDLSTRGIAFNVMTNCVNFMDAKLYYRSPVEVLAFCLSNLSSKVKLDQSYPIYEFTMYVYKD